MASKQLIYCKRNHTKILRELHKQYLHFQCKTKACMNGIAYEIPYQMVLVKHHSSPRTGDFLQNKQGNI